MVDPQYSELQSKFLVPMKHKRKGGENECRHQTVTSKQLSRTKHLAPSFPPLGQCSAEIHGNTIVSCIIILLFYYTNYLIVIIMPNPVLFFYEALEGFTGRIAIFQKDKLSRSISPNSHVGHMSPHGEQLCVKKQ